MTYSRLELLPRELLDYILGPLSTEPPSIRDFNRRPQQYCFSGRAKDSLKGLSLSCPRLRVTTLPHLYKHATFRIGDWKDFLSFCSNNGLENAIESVNVIVDDSAEKEEGKEYYSTYYVAFSKVLEALPLISSFVIRCSPSDFHLLTGCHANNVDAWEFNMPWHTFQLMLQPKDRKEANKSLSPAPVFEILPWTSFSVNEGSFLRAYTQYEYFLRQPPTILIAARKSPGHEQLRAGFLESLRSFSYTAIFPFYNHVGNILNLIETGMPNLHTLSICLGPHPDEYDSINSQETEQSSGKIDFHDAWMEFETSYELVAYVVQKMGWRQKLRVFKSVDWTYGGEVRRITEERILSRLDNVPEGTGSEVDLANAGQLDESGQPSMQRIWQHCGGGVWKNEGKAPIDFPEARLPDLANLVI